MSNMSAFIMFVGYSSVFFLNPPDFIPIELFISLWLHANITVHYVCVCFGLCWTFSEMCANSFFDRHFTLLQSLIPHNLITNSPEKFSLNHNFHK